MKKEALIALLLIMSFSAIAQNYIDVVTCKDGRIFKGVIDEKTDSYVRVSFADKTSRLIYTDDIESISKEEGQIRKTTSATNSDANFDIIAKNNPKPKKEITPINSKKGWHFVAGYKMSAIFPGIWGWQVMYSKLPTISAVASYRFNPLVSVGIGTDIGALHQRVYAYGVYYHGRPPRQETECVFAMPLYMNPRTNFTKNNVSPYFSLDFGYMFSSEWCRKVVIDYDNNYDGRVFGHDFVSQKPSGILLRPGMGIEFNVGKKRMFVGLESDMVFLGRKVMDAEEVYTKDYTKDRSIHSNYTENFYSLIDISIGFEF